MNLTLEEQETHFNMTADDRGTWHVYSDDFVMQRRLEAAGATLVNTAADGIGKFYTMRADQITFRKGTQLSDDERTRRSERMKAMRAAQMASE